MGLRNLWEPTMTSDTMPSFALNHYASKDRVERLDKIHVENDGTLVVRCEEIFESGSSQRTQVRVTENDTVSVELEIIPTYLAETPARHAMGELQHEALAQHLRALAVPLLTTKHERMALGIDLIIGAAFQTIPLKPMVVLTRSNA